LLDQAYGLLREDYAGDKEKLLAAIESAKIKAIKNAENLYKGSKQKLSRALSKIERDSRKAINEIQNAGEKAVNRVRSTFEEGGNVNNKIYIGQYTMGPNKNLGKVKFANGSPTDPPSNLPKAQIGKYIPTWANPNNWGVEDYTDKYKTWDEAYAAAKKAGLTEIMWNKGPNPGRKNLEYAGTPRQEVGAYGIKGKPVHSSDLPIQINKYDAFHENYLPGHISAGYVGRQPSLEHRTSVNKTLRGTNKMSDNKADQNLFVYDSRLNPKNVRPGYNLVTNNCADAVCDALSLSDRDAIETPSGVVEKLLNSQEHPSLDVTGRTYADYKKKLLSDYNILGDNAKYWLGIASSPDNKDLSKLIIRTIQANLSEVGYELPKSSRRAYSNDDIFGRFDGVFGEETKAALLDYQNKSKQPKDLGKVSFQNGGAKPAQKSYYSHRDSVDHQADKILQYEQLKGGPGGIPLPSYSDPKYKSMIMDYILPEVDKIMPNASAMEKSEAIDFVFNAGWDKSNNTIKKDPRAYAIQEYYRKFDPSKLDKDGKWAGRKNAPYSFDQEYDSTIGKLSENERRILMNKGRDWYYQNINNPSPGVPSSDYYDTWYGRIWNTNDFSEFNPNNRNLTHPSRRRENGGPTDPPYEEGKPKTQEELNYAKRYGQIKPASSNYQPAPTMREALTIGPNARDGFYEPTWENFLEFFDPTGALSHDDARDAYARMKARGATFPNLDEGLDMFGAVPLFGKLKYAGIILKKGKDLQKAKYIKELKKFYNSSIKNSDRINRADALEDETGFLNTTPNYAMGGPVKYQIGGRTDPPRKSIINRNVDISPQNILSSCRKYWHSASCFSKQRSYRNTRTIKIF
jgi:peptidoglycan hydrolase-like protein with peptidoglycan-binding domain